MEGVWTIVVLRSRLCFSFGDAITDESIATSELCVGSLIETEGRHW
jgi:hypothetical protein